VITHEEYLAKLDRLLDHIFARSDDLKYTVNLLAAHANLSFSTVKNINERKTRLPRIKTVICLAHAVGLEVELGLIARPAKKKAV
jgi:hypothetical protein